MLVFIKHGKISNQIIIIVNLKYQHPRGIVFKIKSGYKLELLSKETMRLLGSLSDTINGLMVIKIVS